MTTTTRPRPLPHPTVKLLRFARFAEMRWANVCVRTASRLRATRSRDPERIVCPRCRSTLALQDGDLEAIADTLGGGSDLDPLDPFDLLDLADPPADADLDCRYCGQAIEVLIGRGRVVARQLLTRADRLYLRRFPAK